MIDKARGCEGSDAVIDAMTDNIPEPLAGLIRDHRRIEQRLGEATRTVTAAALVPSDAALLETALGDGADRQKRKQEVVSGSKLRRGSRDNAGRGTCTSLRA